MVRMDKGSGKGKQNNPWPLSLSSLPTSKKVKLEPFKEDFSFYFLRIKQHKNKS